MDVSRGAQLTHRLGGAREPSGDSGNRRFRPLRLQPDVGAGAGYLHSGRVFREADRDRYHAAKRDKRGDVGPERGSSGGQDKKQKCAGRLRGQIAREHETGEGAQRPGRAGLQ